MAARTGKKQPDRRSATAVDNERSRVAWSAEWLAIQALNNDLVLERHRADVVSHVHVRFNAGDSADSIASRPTELMHDHVALSLRRSAHCTDVQDSPIHVGGFHFSNSGIDGVHRR